MTETDRYTSPLAQRNASPQMQAIWSPRRKFTTWRRLWLALAEAERELGLAITDAQVEALRANLDNIDFDAADAYERKLRHDVMAHIHAYGDAAPEARPIIHLGATSQFVNCNTEVLLIDAALDLVAGKLAAAVDALATFAAEQRALPTLAFTHYQPAQPTTVGKRAAMWAHDLALALEEVELRRERLRLRGVKGTTGTQASFLELFNGDHQKVEQLDRRVCEKLGWPADKRYAITGQTYPRVADGPVFAALGMAAAAAARFATDMRLLANRKELEEPFEAAQVGSSAMPYKRNPMRCERICGLSRFVIAQTTLPLTTAAEQWLERTLDDSSTRRLSLPEPFLALDGVLELVINVARGIVVYPATIQANLLRELPFMATENLMMAAVNANRLDRQEVHETIRRHAQAAARRVKAEAADNDLLDRLRGEAMFEGVDLDAALDPALYVGRAPEQVDAFIADVVEPIRKRYAEKLSAGGDVKV